jgi:hypothetical protein
MRPLGMASPARFRFFANLRRFRFNVLTTGTKVVWRSEYHHRKAKLYQQLAKTAPDLAAATQFRMLAAEQLILARKATAASQQQQQIPPRPIASNVIQLRQG